MYALVDNIQKIKLSYYLQPALGPTQSFFIHWVPCFSEVKRPGRGANHQPHLAPRLKK